MTIKLLHVITGLRVGGAETMLLDLVTNTNNTKFEVHVISLSEEIELLDKFKQYNIKVTALCLSNHPKNLYQLVYRLYDYIKKNQINIVHAHLSHALIAVSLVKLFWSDFKIVFSSHSVNLESKLREIMIFFLRPLRMIDIVFTPDMSAYYYKKNLAIIPTGIDFSRYLTAPKPNANKLFQFICIGRLEAEKNHSLIIDSAKVLCSLGYKFKIYIVGSGSLEKIIEEKIAAANLTDTIFMLGLSDDVPKLLSESNCLLLSSFWEGLPLVVLEAAASKVLVVSTMVGGLKTILNQDNSLPVYGFSVDEFSSQMLRALDESNSFEDKTDLLYKQLKVNNSILTVQQKLENLYLEMVAK